MEGEGLVDIQPPKRQPINIMPYPQITLFGGGGHACSVLFYTKFLDQGIKPTGSLTHGATRELLYSRFFFSLSMLHIQFYIKLQASALL